MSMNRIYNQSPGMAREAKLKAGLETNALVARVEQLEAENAMLRELVEASYRPSRTDQ